MKFTENFIFLILVLGFGCNEKRITQYNIGLFFDKVHSIKLDTTFYEGIKSLDVDDNGRLLVTNEKRTDIILYNRDGIFQNKFSTIVDSLFPGFNWSPNRGFFLTDNNLFISNNGPWGVSISSDLTELNPLGRTYIAGSDLTFDESNNIYAFISNYLGIYITKFDSNGDVIISKFGNYPKKFANIIDKAIIGNSLVYKNGSIFFKTIAEPKIYKYSLEGQLLDTFEHVPTYYRRPKRDIRTETMQYMMADIRSFAEKYSANFSIHALEKDKILVQYSNYNYEYGLQILSVDGDNLLPHDLLVNYKVLATHDDMLYMIDAKSYHFDENYEPEIIIYRLKSNF